MARTKSGSLPPFVKLLTLLQEGNVVTKDEIEAKLGNDIYTYRLSTYIWHIKTNTDGIVKVVKDGRIVTGYQITNPQVIKDYLKSVGADSFVPGQTTLKPSVAKQVSSPVKSLASLKAKPAKAAKPAKVKAPAKVEEDIEVTELTD
jgi:hypothetical protein